MLAQTLVRNLVSNAVKSARRRVSVRISTADLIRISVRDGIGLRTVEFHRANVMTKFGASNTAELISQARARGVVERGMWERRAYYPQVGSPLL